MAKKKKKSGTRRRRVGAAMTASNPIIKYGPILAGFLMADMINKPIDTATKGKVDAKVLGAAQGGIGAYLVFGKGKPSMVKSIAGGLLLGSGAKRLMSSLGVGNINGYGTVPVIGGYGNVPVIGAPRPRRMGSYSTAGQLGSYAVPRPVRIMSGVGNNSGYNSGSGSSGYMG